MSRKDLLLVFNAFNQSDCEIFKLACALCYLTISFPGASNRQYEGSRDEISIETVSVTENSTTQTSNLCINYTIMIDLTYLKTNPDRIAPLGMAKNIDLYT